MRAAYAWDVLPVYCASKGVWSFHGGFALDLPSQGTVQIVDCFAVHDSLPVVSGSDHGSSSLHDPYLRGSSSLDEFAVRFPLHTGLVART